MSYCEDDDVDDVQAYEQGLEDGFGDLYDPEDTYWRCSACQRIIPDEEGRRCWRCGDLGTRLTRSMQ